MARGGMYDQLGGGFARYSVDARWLVPHFEKMLYDNAQLASLYLHAWLAFGDPECRRICEETLDYVLREMTDPAGGFYSAQDADSEGHEGKFFVWTRRRDPRGARAARRRDGALAYWGVDRGPNFEGKSILYVAGEPDPAPSPKLGASSTRRASAGCTPGATTRSSPPGMVWRAGPSRRRAAPWTGRTTSRQPSATRNSS